MPLLPAAAPTSSRKRVVIILRWLLIVSAWGEIVLRDKDRLQFGEAPPLRYRAGNVGRRGSGRHRPPSSDRYRTTGPGADVPGQAPPRPGAPIAVPALLTAALEEAAHPRALLGCFEALDGRCAVEELEASRRRLESLGVPQDETARVLDRARVAVQERVWRVADRLFTTTRENLGRSVEAWLAWWFDARGHWPQQLRDQGPRARGQLVITPAPDREGFSAPLVDHEEWSVGRADDADVVVPERSVSRRHVTIIRLLRRYAFHDLGSRFGTSLRGQRREVGLLVHGDVLELGRARLRYEDLRLGGDEETAQTGRLVGVDPMTFAAMVELRSPAVIEALARLLDSDRLVEACVAAAVPFEERAVVAPIVGAFLEDQRTLALEVLPSIAHKNLGGDVRGWLAWVDEHRAALPPQVEPAGWVSG